MSQKSIEKGLKQTGISEQVSETIMEMYAEARTRLSVGGKTTRRIKINAGVKQGCSWSPLLFNLIIDELIERLKKLNISIQVREELLC